MTPSIAAIRPAWILCGTKTAGMATALWALEVMAEGEGAVARYVIPTSTRRVEQIAIRKGSKEARALLRLLSLHRLRQCLRAEPK